MLILRNDDIRPLLNARLVIEAVEKSYTQLTAGEAACRPHIALQVPTQNPDELYQWGTTEGGSAAGYFAIRMMSDIRYEVERQGIRTQEKYCVRPGTFCGLIFLFSVSTGVPLAILNDGVIQQMRVGADAALGVKYMARKDSGIVGVFGAGNLARTVMDSVRQVRNITRILVYDPIKNSRERYVEEMTERYQIETIALDDPRDLYQEADILAECTNSTDRSVVLGRYVERGTHIVSVGRRLDDETFRRIDRSLRFGNATPLAGQPEILDEHLVYMAPRMRTGNKPEGQSTGFRQSVDNSKVVYFKEILRGAIGREEPDDITYSERGNIMGAQFHAIAGRVYELARERGAGTEIPTEWFLQDIRS